LAKKEKFYCINSGNRVNELYLSLCNFTSILFFMPR
jgi:hypothetical protein